MNGSNWFVLQQLNQWLAQGMQPWLATVIETYGSSPRPVGSMMIYHPEKGIVGSLSGGCIEQELIQRLAEETFINFSKPLIIRYGEDADQRSRLSLPCGGHLDVLLEKVTQADRDHFETLEQSLISRQWISRRIDLASHNISITHDVTVDDQTDIHYRENHVTHALKPHDKLLLVGAGEVARCLAEICKNLEFDITLCDFRDEFLQGWQVDGVKIIKTMPDDLISAEFHDRHCAIVALAHDPRVDDMAMMEALKTQAFYVGAMGSMTTSNQRRKRLLDLDVSPTQIQALRAPIGLNIGSRTPYEIAVSIAADLISARTHPQ